MYNPHLKTFIDVAQCGSFSKAAKKNYISTTAIIKQIDLLERDMGVRLFTRTKGGAKLTKSGEYIFKEARMLITQAEEIMRRAKELDGTTSQTIRMGVSQRDYNRYLMNIIADHIGHNNDLQLQIIPLNDSHRELTQHINEIGNDIDIVFTSTDNARIVVGNNVLNLFESPLRLGMSRDHRLAKRNLITINDLEGETIYLLAEGLSFVSDQIRSSLKLLNEIHIINNDYYDYTIFNTVIREKALVLWAESWGEFNPMFRSVSVDWDYKNTFGIIYPNNPTDAVRDLVRFLEQKSSQKYFRSIVSQNPRE